MLPLSSWWSPAVLGLPLPSIVGGSGVKLATYKSMTTIMKRYQEVDCNMARTPNPKP